MITASSSATLITWLAREQGLGILLVEQHVSHALDICDKAVVLNQGRIVLEGSADDLKQQSDVLTSSYLGVPLSYVPK